jgi:predicted patatin/cPLA2 family phospholipase
MRGVVSAGALTVLHFLGLKRCFDVTYGSSAGAMTLTYFLSVRPPSIQR